MCCLHGYTADAVCVFMWCCAADCGAGVGRVSEQLLLAQFHCVDLLEPSRHLLDAAQKTLKAAVAGGSYPAGHALGQCLCQGLQEFEPQPGRWATQHLRLSRAEGLYTDRRAKQGSWCCANMVSEGDRSVRRCGGSQWKAACSKRDPKALCRLECLPACTPVCSTACSSAYTNGQSYWSCMFPL